MQPEGVRVIVVCDFFYQYSNLSRRLVVVGTGKVSILANIRAVSRAIPIETYYVFLWKIASRFSLAVCLQQYSLYP